MPSSATEEQRRIVKERTNADIFVSAETNYNIEELKEIIYKKLDFISIFLKEPGKEADLKIPLIVKRDCTLRNICEKLHRDFVTKFKFARVWGKSVRFDGQKLLKLDHILQHEDILELHLK